MNKQYDNSNKAAEKLVTLFERLGILAEDRALNDLPITSLGNAGPLEVGSVNGDQGISTEVSEQEVIKHNERGDVPKPNESLNPLLSKVNKQMAMYPLWRLSNILQGNTGPTLSVEVVSAEGPSDGDYAPGEDLFFIAQNLQGDAVEFSLQETEQREPGNGVLDNYGSFTVVDNSAEDLDPRVGAVKAAYQVPPDPDGPGPEVAPALNATLELTAKGVDLGPDGLVNGNDVYTGEVATTTFTDAVGVPAIPSGDVDPFVWAPDPSKSKWENGNPRGYREGDTALMSAKLDADSGIEYSAVIALQVHELPFTNAYGFIDFLPPDTTIPWGDPSNPIFAPPNNKPGPLLDTSNPLWDTDHPFIWGYNVEIDIIDSDLIPTMGRTDPGPDGILGTSDDLAAASNYLGVYIEFTIGDNGTPSNPNDDFGWIFWGGQIAAISRQLPADLEPIFDPDGDGLVGAGEGASNMTGVFQSRLEGAGDKTINFKPNLIDPAPEYTITKTVIDINDPDAEGRVDEAGDIITYEIVVTNNGNFPITGVIRPLAKLNIS
jgi:hypothetical protein